MNKKILSVVLTTMVTLGGLSGITVTANEGNNSSTSNYEITSVSSATKSVYSHTQDGNKHNVMVSMGECSNSGYVIEIDKIEFKENTAIIHVTESFPKEDGIYLCVTTYPKDRISFEKEGITKIVVVNESGKELNLGNINDRGTDIK